MRKFELVALTPPGLPEPSIAISATMAGGLGVLDLEYTQDKLAAPVLDALATLARYAKNDYGIKLRSSALVAGEVAELISGLPRKPSFVILTCRKSGDGNQRILKEQVQAIHNQELSVLWEAICLEEARFGEQIGVDGIIAKGHESGGRIGEQTTFILLQRLLKHLTLPIYAQGGIGLHTASACYASGAAGVVLDSQLLLTRESPLPEEIKNRIAAMDGSETAYFGHALGEACRIYSRPNIPAVEELRQMETKLLKDERPKAEVLEEWHRAILSKAGWDSLEENLLFLGQDAAFAAPLVNRFVTVGGILEGIRQATHSHVQTAHNLRPLDEGSPFALLLGTRYPIFQGPMARISDTASFAATVAEAGGIPFLAISLMSAGELKELLEETRRLLGDRPWGVGLMGFLPPHLFSEQLKIVCKCRPPFALIAGGRPKQNRPLEEAGITTYIHVPSTGLLRIFLQNGDRHFILEGRESGGHVGPRTSFVLWEAMIDEILEHLKNSPSSASEYHVLFAGGIHDALSASMVAVVAAPLAQLGVNVGVQMGTAYLFTEELVRTGGITDIYQDEAIKCDGTVVLEVGPGHANRCICSSFAKTFEEEKRKLKKRDRSPEEIRLALEQLSIGSLHVAAKGTTLVDTDDGPKIIKLSADEQLEGGVYMIGQAGAIKDKAYNIETLHHEVSVESTKLLEDVYRKKLESQDPRLKAEDAQPKADIAIIGMASVFPAAGNKQAYWENILNKVSNVTEVPKERWDWELYYDQDPRAKDKVYSKWGYFLDGVPFDPVKYGMPPTTIPSIEPLQLVILEMVDEALKDAGYDTRAFPRERTSVIIGASGGAGDLGQGYGVRSSFPMLFGESSAEILSHIDGRLPEWTEDSFAGILMNVAAGRVANRFDLGGENYTVDAACASSLAAVHLAVKELNTYNSDVVIAGGADTMQSAFAYLCFGKTLALSRTGQCRPLDEKADGIVLGEGIAILILKRLEDAERDGDTIYAVIKAMGSSSDGRDKSMTAPRPEGQALALRRAYQRAKVSPSTVELIEAHGTGTVVGDRAEIQALSQVFNEYGVPRQYCAVGSVKSMIGHTKSTAGLAGLMKAALALHHKVLPPTLGVQRPNPSANFPESPFYVNTETRPWIDSGNGHPRRAGVSAFGFGGTNFHTVLEEYTGYRGNNTHTFPIQEWPSELFIWRGSSRQEIVERTEALEKQLQSLSREAKLPLRDLAFSVYEESKRAKSEEQEAPNSKPCVHSSLAIVATSLYELRQKLVWAREALTKGTEANDPRGIYFTEQPLAGTQDNGKVAFLFPGQGSQYVNMLIDLTTQFPEVRAHFERANRVLSEAQEGPMANSLSSMLLSRYVFPQPWFTEEEKLAREEALRETNIAQPAIGAASMAMFHLLGTLGVRPDFVAGHSYGEYVALCAAGVFDEDVLIALSEARGRFIVESAGKNPGTMAAINAGVQTVSKITTQIDGVYIANKNSPEQTVITGTEEGVKGAVEQFKVQGIRARIVPVACAFHSPIVASTCKRLAEFLSGVELSSPKTEVFSNTTADTYPKEPKAIAELLTEHLVNPVEFVREILAMHEAGARIFVEVGPRSILTKLADEILSDKPRLTVASDQPTRNGLTQLQHLLGQLTAHGMPVKLDRLYQGRKVKLLDLNKLQEVSEPTFSSTTWLVNGHRAKPISEANKPEPLFPQVNLIVAGESEKSRKQQDAEAQQAHSVSQKQANAVQNESRKLEAGPSASQQGRKQDNHPHPGSMSPEIGHSNAREDGVAQVMMQYQQLMNRFLDTQKSVMLTYLQSRGVTASQKADGAGKAIASRLSSTISHQSPDTQPSEPAQATSPSPTPVTPPEEIQHESKVAEVRDSGLPIQKDDERQAPAPDSTEIDSAKPGIEIPTREELTERLLQIVSERTGYPKEMLDLDLDTEADLGIDSIKRIEILSSLLAFYVFFEQRDDLQSNDRIEELAQLKTLRGIIDWLESRTQEVVDTTGVQPAKQEDFRATAISSTEMRVFQEATETEPLSQQNGLPKPSETLDDVVNRYILTAEEKPLEEESKIAFVTNRVLVLTDDGNGIARSLAESLKAVGHTVALVKTGEKTQQISQSSYAADLTKRESVAELLKIIREQQGPIGGFIHLLPLKPGKSFNEMDLTSWRACLKLEVKSLFYFAKELGDELKEAASSGDACFMAATAMGGTFASATSNNSAFFPGHGGVAGLLKSIAHEWSDVRTKVIDFSANGPASTRIHQLMQEITSDDGLVEVGYSNGRRYILTPKLAPLDKTEPIVLDIDSSWVILVTGGARGITADVALQLAQNYQPTLLLVGRSALPVSEESPETAGLTALQELKAAIMEKMRKAGQEVTPTQVEAAYSRLLKDREMQENIAKMLSTGAKVHYYQVDVRDEQQFGGLIDEIYQTYGRLDGVIHGAGTIEDKLIRDKTPESFDRVFDTKVDSAFILSQKLRAEKLSFFVFFSSVAGRFGNRGQSDYAAANEVYNKLAICLDKRCPGRVVSAIWGPWARAGGMVSAELEKQFAQRGIELLPRTVGPKKLDEELRYGRRGDVEVILAGRGRDAREAEGIEQERKQESMEVREYDAIPPTPQAEVTTARFPLISTRDSISREVDGTIRLIRKLDVARDTYLNDHKLDGNPVLPMAMAMELMAEVAMLGWQRYELSQISDLQVLQGIVLEDGQLDVQVIAKPLAEASERTDTTSETPAQIEMSIASVKEPQHVYYRAKGELQKELPPPISQMSIYLEEERPFPMDVREVYRQWLFHGPTFHGITEIEGIGTNGIIAKLNSSSPEDCLASAPEPFAKSKWIIDPVVIDSGLQLIILWARENLDMTPLPTSMLRYTRFGSMSGQKIECQVHTHMGSASNILIGKFLFFGEDGRLLGLMESMKGVCSKALNRLSVKRENIKLVQ